MPLRPIDAIFVHPKRRIYIVYYRGQLWELPRMKIDSAAWQRRQPYLNDTTELYLSHQQVISDPMLAQQLRTLNLPAAIRGSTLAKFEAWWEVQGFSWLKNLLAEGKSPLAAHDSQLSPLTTKSKPSTDSVEDKKPIIVEESAEEVNASNNDDGTDIHKMTAAQQIVSAKKPALETTTDIFATMLAELSDEVLHQRHSLDN